MKLCTGVGERAEVEGERFPWCCCSTDALLRFEFRDEEIVQNSWDVSGRGESLFCTDESDPRGRASCRRQSLPGRPSRTLLGRSLPPLPARGVPPPLAHTEPAAAAASTAGSDSVLGSVEGRGRAGEGRPAPLPGAAGAMPGVEGTARRGQPGPCGSSHVESGVSRSLKDSRGLERELAAGLLVWGLGLNIWLCFSSCARSGAKGRGWGCRERAASGPAQGCAWVICPEFVLLFHFPGG